MPSILIRITPRPGPDSTLTSSAGHSIARASRVAAMIVSAPVTCVTPTTSTPSGIFTNLRPARVLGSMNGARLKRRA